MNYRTFDIAFGLAILMLLLPNAYAGITVTTSGGQNGNIVGSSTTYGASIEDEINSVTTLFSDGLGLSKTMTGSGDLTDSRFVSNTAGSYAEEGVTIGGAESYTYTYNIFPGEGAGWSASLYPTVSAGESLDVANAYYINAYAQASNKKGYSATASIEISDPEKGASLLGYSNDAVANAGEVIASQNANLAKGVISINALATDKSGREAKSSANFIGSDSVNQLVAIDKSSAFASQDFAGVGYFEGAITSAKDGKGNEAVSLEEGAFSGKITKNSQWALVDAANALTGQEVEFEYGPFHYEGVGLWDKCIFGVFSTSTKFKNAISAASQEISYGEHYQSALESGSSATAAGSNIYSNLIGVAVDSVLAKDKSGKEAKTESSYIGVYGNEMSANIGKSSSEAEQNLKGVGYFKGSSTSANDEKGHQALADAEGASSGNLIVNWQKASAGASGAKAIQENELEYMPVSYQTGTYDYCAGMDFATWTKYGANTEAKAEENIQVGEHFRQHQEAFADATTAMATNDAFSIAVASGSVLAKDKSGKEAKSSEDSYTGVYSNEQSASIDGTTAKAALSLKGVGYFQGASSSANDGKGHQAVADEFGGYAGNMITNSQNVQASKSGALVSQQAKFEFMPVSYQTGTYDQTISVDFTSSAKDGCNTEAIAQQSINHGEHFEHVQSSSAGDATATATNNANVIGIASGSVFAKDKSGKEAKSVEESYTGVYSNEQYALVDKTAAKADLSLRGVGYYEGAKSYSKYTKGQMAIAEQNCGFSGNMIINSQSTSASTSGLQASQETGFEYQPISYMTGTYDQKVIGTFSTLTKDIDGREAEAKTELSHTEKVDEKQSSSIDKSTANAENSANLIIGVATPSVSVKDKKGREANSQSSFIGVYSFDQSASMDKSAVQTSQDLKGVGWFEGASTFAKDGKGKEAITYEDGSFSGNMIKNKLSASIGSSGIQADQDISSEYRPVSYQTGVYDQKVAGIFSTLTKDSDGREAEARVDVAHTEHFANIQSASIDKSTAEASNFAVSIIGVAIPSVSVKDKSGKKANSIASFTGVYSLVQSASLDKSVVQSSLDMNGVGYFAGANTFATDGKYKEALTKQEGAISGNMGLNKQSALVGTKAEATQSAMFQYMPVSYQTGTYDISWMTFSSQAKAKGILNPVTEEKWDVFTSYQITPQEVHAP